MVSPVMGQAGCPGREPDCRKPAGTWVRISARIYDSNSLGDRTREGRGSECRHAGTISRGDRAEEGRRSDRWHSANSLWERVESCVTLLVGIVICASRARGEENSIIGCKATKVKSEGRRSQAQRTFVGGEG